jgi:O-antigen ligase
MSSIAAPNRIEAVPALTDHLRTALGAVLFVALIGTLTPFQAESLTGAAGNVVNQFGYGILALLALGSHLLFTERLVARALLRPAWIAMALCIFASVAQALDPGLTLRTALFTLVAMIACTGVVTLPPDVRAFRVSLSITALTILGLSYLGILLMPQLAVHQAVGEEAQHAGLWRGIYSHKNIAAPVMAGLFFSGLYLIRCGDKRIGWVVTLLACLFVLKTGSKTSTSLLPLVAFLVIGGRAFGGRILPVMVLFAAMTVMALMTIGAVLSPTLDAILQTLLPGTTFTGRADLWRFALETMEPRQWTGYGLESFWLTNNVFSAETPFELSWDPRGIVNAHSGYLDIAIAMGWPSLIVASFVLLFLPAYDYIKCPAGRENQLLCDLFLMIIAFVLLNSFLESYFFRRNDPIWMFLWTSIVGMRLVSRFPIRD